MYKNLKESVSHYYASSRTAIAEITVTNSLNQRPPPPRFEKSSQKDKATMAELN